MIPIWTLVVSNAKIVRSGDILLSPAVYIVPSTRSITVLTKLNAIERWHGIAKQTLKLISLGSKLRKKNLAPICSSTSIAKTNTMQTAIITLSKDTDLIENSM